MRGAQGNTLLNGELNELCVTFEAEELHHSIFMECDGARCHAEKTGRFFHGEPFHEQLKHLALARSQFTGCGTLAFLGKGSSLANLNLVLFNLNEFAYVE